MGADELDHLKMKEQWLREELRSTRSLMNSTVHWGITVLTAASLNLYYLRRDILKRTKASYISLPHWLIGTILLIIVSLVFFTILSRHRKRFRHHRKQLSKMRGGYSEIEELHDRPGLLYETPEILFLTIPLLDFALWLALYGDWFRNDIAVALATIWQYLVAIFSK